MDLSECIKKVDRFLSKDNAQPLIVDVQNHKDRSDLIVHYNVGTNTFIKVSDYCNKDEFPQIDRLFYDLETKEGTSFVTGLSPFLMLCGEQELRKVIREILSMTTAGHVVVITYQCHRYMDFNDPRLLPRITVLDGMKQTLPEIYFSSLGLSFKGFQTIEGINSFSDSIENTSFDKLLIHTGKKKADYPGALYRIIELSKAYDVLSWKDPKTRELSEGIGTDEQWRYALERFETKPDWSAVIDGEFGNHMNLGIQAQNYNKMDPNRSWLYFVGLKLFGANDWCLNYASSESSDFRKLISNAYRSILKKNASDADFWACYESRKKLLNRIGNPSGELTAYCKTVVGNGKNAIYYLTDNTEQEKEAIFIFLNRYGEEYKRDELMGILERVYPDLFAYLQPYRFENELLDNYFQDYKYQKVINKILPEFEKIVLEQAEKREYNLILEPRSSKIEKISTKDSLLYFMDAMGVEYLGYIVSVCRDLQLKIKKITVCRCELPSITSQNKEFLNLWNEKQIVSIKDIDDIKHHGKFDYDYYSNSKLPLHLIKEMEIIHDTLEKIRNKLNSDRTIKQAVMIADHGASRLAVLHDSENVWEMKEKGQHSGRCCYKSDVDVQPDYATDAGDFWALANYDRFKGGRKANVEVHGGATLEEICVPIIELTYSEGKIETHLMSAEAESIDFTGAPAEIEVSFRKKAAIKIFMTEELPDVSITADGKKYKAEPLERGFYRVDMPDLKKPGTYSVDVYSGDNIVAEKLILIVRREGQREEKLL